MSAEDRTAEKWGRVAVGLPGWRWMPGMLVHFGDWDRSCDHHRMGAGPRGMDTSVPLPGSEWWPDPDDPATAGCLLAMLAGVGFEIQIQSDSGGGAWRLASPTGLRTDWEDAETLGRACIAAAEALGRWPGGAE